MTDPKKIAFVLAVVLAVILFAAEKASGIA